MLERSCQTDTLFVIQQNASYDRKKEVLGSYKAHQFMVLQ